MSVESDIILPVGSHALFVDDICVLVIVMLLSL